MRQAATIFPSARHGNSRFKTISKKDAKLLNETSQQVNDIMEVDILNGLKGLSVGCLSTILSSKC